MLPSTLGTLIFSRIFIWFFQSIAPISILYNLLLSVLNTSQRLPPALETWFLAETLFFLLIYIPISYTISRPGIKTPTITLQQRQALFTKCLSTITNPIRYISLWHHNTPISLIGSENVREWLNWAFLSKSTLDPSDENELSSYISALESLLPPGTAFPPGRNTNIHSLRPSLDPVRITHKPLLYYIFGVLLADLYTSLILSRNGYEHHAVNRYFTVFPPRPQTCLSRYRSPAMWVSYWYRPHTRISSSKTKFPILYIHGIGILHTYVDFLSELATTDPEIGILVLEIQPISFRITSPSLPSSTLCAEILSILNFHNISHFVLVANSYGTVISTQLLRHPVLGARVKDVVFIDPVVFLLHLPDMAWNFSYRSPRSASEWQLYYFASTDIGAAHTLARCFEWGENVLWKEGMDLRLCAGKEGKSGEGRRWTVVLSERDIIVNSEEVGRYLTRPQGVGVEEDRERGDGWKVREWVGEEGGLDVVWLKGANHAEVFDTRLDRAVVIDVVMNYSRGEKRRVRRRTKEWASVVEGCVWCKILPARVGSMFGLDGWLEAKVGKGVKLG